MQAMRVVAVMTAALGLVACAGGVHWEHSETGQLNLAKDHTECERLAAAEAWHEPLTPLFPLHDRFGRRRFAPFDPLYHHDRFWRKMQLRDFCMKSRGYRLVADPPAEPDAAQ
jgi:hypothetical protein